MCASDHQWNALVGTVGKELCPAFMFMGVKPVSEAAGGEVFLYKHSATRRYLNIDARGATFAYRDGAYFAISNDDALNHVFG